MKNNNILINREIIAKLNPLQNRFDSYISHYGDKSFTKQQFMGLKHINHEDRVWVALRFMSGNNLRSAAAEIAEYVLPIFEKAYPADKRPRLSIEAARAGLDAVRSDEVMQAYAISANVAGTAAEDASVSASPAASLAALAAAQVAYTYTSYYLYDYPDGYLNCTWAFPSIINSIHAISKDTSTSQAERLKQEKLIRKILLKYWK